MSTIHQLVTRYERKKKKRRSLLPALTKCPQKKGVVQRVFIQTPKKPNSAKRKVARVKLCNNRFISCYIPGIGHNLIKHAVVWVRGGRVQDLIGVRYRAIHGKEDFLAPRTRITRRTKYGVKSR